MDTDEQRDRIIQQLESLNVKLARQLSLKQILVTGIIYGIGFFVGSAILATLALGIFGPIVGKISWVQDNFNRGSTILHPVQEQQQPTVKN